MAISVSHLSSLRNKNRRERLEWLGDAVMQEVVARLMAREALAALGRQEAGMEGSDIPAGLRPLSQRFGETLSLAVSNANLSAVYAAELGGLMTSLGLGPEDDHLVGAVATVAGRRLCSSNVNPVTGLVCDMSSPRRRSSRKKYRPDLVEAAIGEAFENSISRRAGCSGGVSREGGEIEPRAAGSQRFAGGHRAALMDRLLSAILSTENLSDFLSESGRSSTGLRESDHAPPAFRNQFDALGGSEDEEHEQDEKYGSNGSVLQASADGPNRPSTGKMVTRLKEQKIANSTAALKNTTVIADVDSHTLGVEGPASKEDQSHRISEKDSILFFSSTVPSCSQPETDSPQQLQTTHRQGTTEKGRDRVQEKEPDRENIAAGRDTVLRLYGAALLRFRVSVFLFCCVPGSADGGVDEQGPRELTMRRQRVMCTENLHAVALHLGSDAEWGSRVDTRSTGMTSSSPAGIGRQSKELPERSEGAEGSGSAGLCAGPGVCVGTISPSNWLRIAVGRASLFQGHSSLFSTRVAALLLSRSGERAGGSTLHREEFSLLSGGRSGEGGQEAAIVSGDDRETTQNSIMFPRGPASTSAATAEAHFCLDSWPAKDFPKANEKAAQMFAPLSLTRRLPSDKTPIKRSASDHSDNHDGGEENNVFYFDDVPYDRENDIDDLERPPRRSSRKRKRAEQPDRANDRLDSSSSSPATVVPLHYAGLVGSLPREKRRLLVRLGHHGYVKVLENLLDRFVRCPGCPITATAVTNDSGPEPRQQQACAKSRSDRLLDALANSAGASDTKTSDTEKCACQSAENDCHHRQGVKGALEAADRPPGKNGAGQDLWDALTTGTPHPALLGLIEPSNLARTEPDRLVLPIPNPFYRRVLHALCLVHGLCSQGGEARATHGADMQVGAEARYRTVEIMRRTSQGRRGIGEGGGVGWGRSDCGGVAAGRLVPVETLLSGR